MDASKLHGIFKALLNGRHERGSGGALYVKDELCAYRFPQEFPESFRGALSDLIEEDGGEHFFVVEEREKQLHVVKYPCVRVLEDIQGTMDAPSDARVEEIDAGDGGEDHTADAGA